MPVAATAPWTLSGLVATARTGTTVARLDLAAPAAGLVATTDGGPDHLLGLDLRGPGGPPVDQWVRGADLTAVYEPDDARRLRAAAMWRVRPAALAAWELVVSGQTSLLHADAALAVVSDVGCDEARWSAPGAACRWRPLGGAGPLPAEAAFVLARRGETSVLLGVHPQDPRRLEVAVDGGRARIVCGIFPTAIEKGVILRSRALAAVGPLKHDEAWAGEVCAAFTASPPFLDT